MTPKEQLIEMFNRESATTLRVLQAYPADRSELRPHPVCKTARELAWIFVTEQALFQVALTSGFDWSKAMPSPDVPPTIADIIRVFDHGRRTTADLIAKRDDALSGTVQFPVAPKTIGDVPLGAFLGLMISDQIHHRGQFSIYLRMAGGKLPSIYGPTHDEPWS